MQKKLDILQVRGSHTQNQLQSSKYFPTIEDLKKVPIEIAANLMNEFV